jgi:hypothetical protein
MLVTTSEQKQSFKTPEKITLRTPQYETIPRLKKEYNLKQMPIILKSLEMDDSCDTVERELVQNDDLWMQEMMTVRNFPKTNSTQMIRIHSIMSQNTDAHEMSETTNGAGIKAKMRWRKRIR